MGLGKFLKKAVRIAAPVAMFAFPGIGTALGTALGATGAGATALGSGLIGAAAGGYGGGGLKGAVTGGALGGLGGYLQGGELSNLSNTGDLVSAGGMPTGNAFDFTSLGGSGTNLVSAGGLPSGTAATLGSLTSPLNISASSSIPAGSLSYNTSGGGLSNMLKNAIGNSNYMDLGKSLASNYLTTSSYEDAIAKIESGLGQYSNTGLSANAQLAKMLGLDEDADEETVRRALEATPGFKFQQQQGEDAINRSLGAQGKVFSGEALKAASEYNTGLSSKYYQDAVNNLAKASNSGYSASAALADAKARAKLAEGDAFTSGLANYLNPVRY